MCLTVYVIKMKCYIVRFDLYICQVVKYFKCDTKHDSSLIGTKENTDTDLAGSSRSFKFVRFLRASALSSLRNMRL